ncbi:MAG: DUF4255 domain-containing protein [Tannerellaceae bacterium]|nr:DUF4255 domain-containing protein [Tannerellaceae bacterium]
MYKTLTFFTQLLNNHLKLSFKLNEEIVSLCTVNENGGQSPKNRVGISLVNIERETSGGIRFGQQAMGNTYSRKTAPSWQLNIYILISMLFSEKQYAESLRLFSGILSFIQKNYIVDLQETGSMITIEPVNLSFQEQSNLWSVNGGNYFPSVLCKLRLLTVDGQEVADLSALISSPGTNSEVKS